MRTYTNIPRTKKFVNNKLSPKLLQEKNASKEYCDALVKLGYTKDEILKAMGVEGPYQSYNDAIDKLAPDALKIAIKNVKIYVKGNPPKTKVETQGEQDPEKFPPDGKTHIDEAKLNVKLEGESDPLSLQIADELLAIQISYSSKDTHSLLDAVKYAKQGIQLYLEKLVNALSQAGYSTSRLNATKEKMLHFYNAYLDKLPSLEMDVDRKGERYSDPYSLNYIDENGERKTQNVYFWQSTFKFAHEIEREGEGSVSDMLHGCTEPKDGYFSGILLREGCGGAHSSSSDNEYRIYIHVQTVLRGFINLFNSL